MLKNISFLLTCFMLVLFLLFAGVSACLPGEMWIESIYTLACGIIYFLFPAVVPAGIVLYMEVKESTSSSS